MKKILRWQRCALFLLIPVMVLFLIISSTIQATAQGKRAVFGEIVTCNIKVGNEDPGNNQKTNSSITASAKKKDGYKNVQPKLNQFGHFDRVFNLKPMQIVPVKLNFPNGTAGEQVIIMAVDGGKLEGGQKGKVQQIDNEKQLAFNFQVGKDIGLYRIAIKKGNDSKVIQLWVGAEQKITK